MRLSVNVTCRHARYVRPPGTIAQRVKALRVHAGSHDKLAAALDSESGGATTRQRVILWEKGAEPSEHYAEQLAAYAAANGFSFTAVDFQRPGRADRLVELESLVLSALERLDRLEARG